MFVPFAALLFNKKREVMLGCSVGHFCSPTNQMVGQRRERRGDRSRRAAGNPPFLCQNLIYFTIFKILLSVMTWV